MTDLESFVSGSWRGTRRYLRAVASLVEPPTSAWRKRRRFVVPALVGLVAFALLALGELDGALGELHEPGVEGASMSMLAHGRGEIKEALTVWNDGHSYLAPAFAPTGIAIGTAHAVVDLAFVPLYVSLMVVVAMAGARFGTIGFGTAGQRALRVALVAIAVLGAADLVENVAELVVLHGPGDGAWPVVLRGAAETKTLLLILILVMVGFLAARAFLAQAGALGRILKSSRVLRIQVAVLALFVVVMLVGPTKDQAVDAVRLWAQEPWLSVWATLALAVFTAAVAVTSARLVALSLRPRADPRPAAVPLVAAAVLLVVVGATYGVSRAFGADVRPLGILGLAVVLLAVGLGDAVASWLQWAEPPGDPSGEVEPSAPLRRLPALLTGVVPVAVGVVATRAGVTGALDQGLAAILPLVYGGLALAVAMPIAVAVTLLRVRLTPNDSPGPLLSTRYVVFAGLCTGAYVVAGGILYTTDRIEFGRRLGVFVPVALFLATLVLGLSVVGLMSEGRRPLVFLQRLGFRRTPVVTGFLLWGLLAFAFDREGFHHIRRDAVESRATYDLPTAFDTWVEQQASRAKPESDAGGRPVVPMFLVASSGGGIKAAAWTAVVVDCIFGTHSYGSAACPDGDWKQVFVGSGASGGSVGLASMAAEQLSDPDAGWVADRLGGDLLSPSVSWQVLVEAPLVGLGLHPFTDRAAVLEESWEDGWRDQDAACEGFVGEADDDDGKVNPAALPWLSVSTKGCDGAVPPLLLLNATDALTGCRFNVSSLDAGLGERGRHVATCSSLALHEYGGGAALPSTRDLADHLCETEDVRLSTAAFLSARYPYVSPTGRIDTPECAPSDTGVAFAVDGGYRDNSGAGALADLLPEIERLVASENAGRSDACVVPFLLLIENGYGEDGVGPLASPPTVPGRGRIRESLAPLQAAFGSFGALTNASPQELAAAFSRPVDASTSVVDTDDPEWSGRRVVQLRLQNHPGVRAPLGWSLSDGVVDGVEAQLQLDANARGLAEINRWLDGSLRCSGTPAAGDKP